MIDLVYIPKSMAKVFVELMISTVIVPYLGGLGSVRNLVQF